MQKMEFDHIHTSTLYSVEITEIRSHFFGKYFEKVMVLVKKVINSCYDEIFIWWE